MLTAPLPVALTGPLRLMQLVVVHPFAVRLPANTMFARVRQLVPRRII